MTLHINHVTKRFGSFTAVDDLSLTINDKQIFGFLGANGAGKTTTFRMILGLIDQSEGQIDWNNQTIDYSITDKIGYLPEERGLYPKMKVKEQMIYLGRLRGMNKQAIIKELDYWLDRFKIPDYKEKKVEELSKGNQQKIQFISAVINQPKLLILDEPFSGLDPVNVELLKEAVIELKEKGTTIVFSSHQMSTVEELCESLCIMVKGKPVVQGSLKDIKRQFGKKNLLIHAEMDLEFLKEMSGVVKYAQTAEGCRLQINNEETSQQILTEIVQREGFIKRFDLLEPSLNDIFIEKVGESYE
ncbi:putative ABC transporter ATP-binding protein YhaQ [Halolactibacillus alkaliphilus]|uniref:Putative ABC transporter ATP-binding protein YhaQ n=1 Tax=Halolactibacillus alkaliphilus TaxID=442899 RepID=A0A511X0P5_9BACI|nr:ABC transporter ATP-binding protein [Halolactibacillus alkaliphilus]GEN56509.1 putative ABC transporter ATP-binding protein YhaQ [Halolactibacillus alkaliphilus]GGN69492.1 putative ABC transporter ATP-binding protein YhaQ [Halolactibacillus alkaliphilus]SFO74564.1 ABC-2 type transport system ATP-binding protein [Halolactibacillus alkaliphilus]